MLRSEWFTRFLAEAQLPAGDEAIIAGIAWCESERAHTLPPTGALNNPLDTEQPAAGATDYNPAGVKNYPTLTIGLQASVATLTNGHYAPIISALKAGAAAETVAQKVSASPWGSQPSPSLVRAVRANRRLYDVPVHTTDAPPGPPPAPGEAPAFPLPATDWFGQPDPDPHNHSGYFSAADRQALEPWQARMKARGWTITVDGRFGPQTYQVCVAFQKEKHLNVTGFVGPKTWAAAWTEPVT